MEHFCLLLKNFGGLTRHSDSLLRVQLEGVQVLKLLGDICLAALIVPMGATSGSVDKEIKDPKWLRVYCPRTMCWETGVVMTVESHLVHELYFLEYLYTLFTTSEKPTSEVYQLAFFRLYKWKKRLKVNKVAGKKARCQITKSWSWILPTKARKSDYNRVAILFNLPKQ